MFSCATMCLFYTDVDSDSEAEQTDLEFCMRTFYTKGTTFLPRTGFEKEA